MELKAFEETTDMVPSPMSHVWCLIFLLLLNVFQLSTTCNFLNPVTLERTLLKFFASDLRLTANGSCHLTISAGYLSPFGIVPFRKKLAASLLIYQTNDLPDVLPQSFPLAIVRERVAEITRLK